MLKKDNVSKKWNKGKEAKRQENLGKAFITSSCWVPSREQLGHSQLTNEIECTNSQIDPQVPRQ